MLRCLPLYLGIKINKMRKIILVLALMTATVCNAQSKNLFGRMPEFLTNAQEKELEEVFQSGVFARFSASLPDGVIVAYENNSRAKEGSLNDIKDQISLFKNRLLDARKEIPKVEFFQWADYKERTEIYPCGLVVVFHDEKVSHVWLDLK